MMVASAANVGGVVHLQIPGSPARPVQPAPSSDQGYGRVLLDSILYFNHTSTFRLYVNQEVNLCGGVTNKENKSLRD